MSSDVATNIALLLRPSLRERARRSEPLSRHCALGVGGPADIWVALERPRELMDLVNLCATEYWPLLVIGNGSNTIFTDAGVRGVVAQINFTAYTVEPHNQEQALLIADAGVHWPQLAYELAKQGWQGLEFGVGIPGTLGGALVSKAGAHGAEIGQAVEWIEVLDARGANREMGAFAPPQIRRYQRDELDLGYRSSRFRAHHQAFFREEGHLVAAPRQMIDPDELILQLSFHLQRADPRALQGRLMQYRRARRLSEPCHYQRGSIFQDPPGGTAEQLLWEADLAGLTYGCARIAAENPNYIVNLGHAKASETIWLIEEAHRRVQQRFGVDLQLDVNLIGE